MLPKVEQDLSHRRLLEPAQQETIYIVTGSVNSKPNYSPRRNDNLYLKFEPSYGVLSIANTSTLVYRQFAQNGAKIDELFIPILSASHSREKMVAIIIIICSLAFLCYFIYSWVSCYLKKPNIKEYSHHEPRELTPIEGKHANDKDEAEEGYDMRPVSGNP